MSFNILIKSRFHPKINKRAVKPQAQIMQNQGSIAIAGYDAEVLVGKSFTEPFQIKASKQCFDTINYFHIQINVTINS
jgi:hypothetical protein